MAELKTKQNDKSVTAFLEGIKDERQREDAFTLLALMKRATGEKPVMWGSSIIGFGSYHYKYASGREGDWMATGFSPRKQNLTVYIIPGFDRYESLMQKVGTYTTGSSCLYLKKLEDVDLAVLEKLVKESVRDIKKMNS